MVQKAAGEPCQLSSIIKLLSRGLARPTRQFRLYCIDHNREICVVQPLAPMAPFITLAIYSHCADFPVFDKHMDTCIDVSFGGNCFGVFVYSWL